MRQLVSGLLVLTASLLLAPMARAACGDSPGDAQAVAETRALIQSTCNCDSNGRHGKYVRCANRVTRVAVRDGSLPSECRAAVLDCEANSTCGRSRYVTC